MVRYQMDNLLNMIRVAAFCPHPPALVPELGGAGTSDLDDLRGACRGAVRGLGDSGLPLVLLGSGPVSLAHSPLARGSLAGYGLPGEFHLGSPGCGGAAELPLSLIVGAWLVRDVLGPRSGALGFSVGPDFAGSRAAVDLLALAEERDAALLVMGDGSARRSTAAPGYLDDRAESFDAAVGSALAGGDAGALADLDADLGADLLAAGAPAWTAAGDLLAGGSYDAEVSYAQAPFGVGYFVASWTLRA